MIKGLKESKGITLIALVITIIVLLILVGIAISMLSGENGILNQVAKAKTETEEKSGKEQIELAVTGAMTNEEHQVKVEDLIEELGRYNLKLDDEETARTKPNGARYVTIEGVTYTITKNGKVEKIPEIIINGEVVTPKNVRNYLGKKVANYTGKETVTIDDIEYKVSPEYRLYYIDFTGKYGDIGVIYLKAECTENNKQIPATEKAYEEDEKPDKIKIKE